MGNVPFDLNYLLHAIQTAKIYIQRSIKYMKQYLYTLNNVKMLNLQKSEQAIRVEQNLYKHVCVTAAFKC